MGSLIFSCPKSFAVLETGIETDDATLKKLGSRPIGVDCPHCQTKHQFRVTDGHLFQMRPRQSQVHYTGLLCDEIDVGGFIQRAMATSETSRVFRRALAAARFRAPPRARG